MSKGEKATMANPYGKTEGIDFLLMAIDGFQLRLDGMQAQLDALRAAALGTERAPKAQPPMLEAAAAKPGKRKDWTPEAAAAKPGKRKDWTPEQRSKQSRRMRKAWKAGMFGQTKKQKEAAATAAQ